MKSPNKEIATGKVARRAWETRRKRVRVSKIRASEAASKEALMEYCEANGWRVAFFEGKTGSPRTGIIDAIAFRINRRNADHLNLWLIQLKGGQAGVSGPEIARLKKAIGLVQPQWALAAFDGEALHVLPDFTK